MIQMTWKKFKLIKIIGNNLLHMHKLILDNKFNIKNKFNRAKFKLNKKNMTQTQIQSWLGRKRRRKRRRKLKKQMLMMNRLQHYNKNQKNNSVNKMHLSKNNRNYLDSNKSLNSQNSNNNMKESNKSQLYNNSERLKKQKRN